MFPLFILLILSAKSLQDVHSSTAARPRGHHHHVSPPPLPPNLPHQVINPPPLPSSAAPRPHGHHRHVSPPPLPPNPPVQVINPPPLQPRPGPRRHRHHPHVPPPPLPPHPPVEDRHPQPLSPSFCDRSVARNACPDPRTSNHVDIESYVGTWYQIASTARYKLSYESGLVCEQANYTLLSKPVTAANFHGATVISVVNSGAAVISRPEAVTFSRLSLTAGAVCSNARIICSLVTPRTSRLRQSLAALWAVELALTDAHPSTAADLSFHTRRTTRLLRLVESEIDSLALNSSLIQQAHARLSQHAGRRSDNLHQVTDLAALSAAAVGTLSGRLLSDAEEAAREILRIAGSVVAGESPSLAYQMSGAAVGIAAELVRIRSFLVSTAAALTNMERMYSSFGTSSAAPGPSWTRAPPVTYGLGFQNSSSNGKFLMDFYGVQSPYWVIDLEGSAAEGYEAALVYWCKEDLHGEIDEDLFVLSRNKKLEDGVLEKFMAAAARYGISTDCDNPLVLTDQRSGSCGAP